MATIKKTRDVFDATKTKETIKLTPHPVTGRLIDNHPGKRTISMKVLVLGLSRCGGMSILAALEQLGYQPYHMAKAIQSPKANLDVWREGLDAKFRDIGKPFGREEFDKILGDYDAVVDLPAACFVEELVEAYPDAKIVLNHRDVDKWLTSMDSTVGEILRWKSFDWLADWDTALVEPFWLHAKALTPAVFGTFDDFSPSSPARESFLKHCAMVKRVAPPGRLLEYRVQEGWNPLCKLLDKKVPEAEFPRVNDTRQMIIAHKIMWWLAVGKMITRIAGITLVILIGLAVAIVSFLWPYGIHVVANWLTGGKILPLF